MSACCNCDGVLQCQCGTRPPCACTAGYVHASEVASLEAVLTNLAGRAEADVQDAVAHRDPALTVAGLAARAERLRRALAEVRHVVPPHKRQGL